MVDFFVHIFETSGRKKSDSQDEYSMIIDF